MIMYRQFFIAIMSTTALTLLSACGGGGGALGSQPDQQPVTVTLSPGSIIAHFQETQSAQASFVATISGQPTGTIYISIVDSDGVLEPQIDLVKIDSQRYEVTLFIAQLNQGHYTGTVTVNMCFSNPCQSQVSGYPKKFPYDITVDPPPPILSLTGAIAGSFPVNFPGTIGVTGTISIPSQIVVTTDTQGLFQKNTDIAYSQDGSASFNFYVKRGISAGHYTGSVVLQGCVDANCTTLVPHRSPVTVPYDLTIYSPPPLTKLTGINDWGMYQGNVKHNGYVPVDINAANIRLRWAWTQPTNLPRGTVSEMRNVAVVGDKLYVTNADDQLYAIRESDGQVQWTRDFSSFDQFQYQLLNQPSADDSNVYVTLGGNLWKLSAMDGSILFNAQYGTQSDRYLSPTVSNGVIYINGGTYGGMYSFDASTGQQNFFTQLPQIDQWTPAVDENFAYANLNPGGGYSSGLFVVNRTSGSLVNVISNNHGADGFSTPVIGDNGLVYTVGGAALDCYDTNANSIKWTVYNSFAGLPVSANGLIYALNRDQQTLEARNESDGSLVWSWPVPHLPMADQSIARLQGDLIVTNSHAFFSTQAGIYAVDISTHQLAWSYNKPGRLALSDNGILYVTGYYNNLALYPWFNAQYSPPLDIISFDTH